MKTLSLRSSGLFSLSLLALLIIPGRAARGGNIIYTDPVSVDMEIGQVDPGYRLDLYRDSNFQASWEHQTFASVYHTDNPGGEDIYYYLVKQYVWNTGESSWDFVDDLWEEEVDTSLVQGKIYNDTGMQARFGRGPIGWISGIPYRVVDLEVVTGVLDIDEAEVQFVPGVGGSIGGITVSEDARLLAAGAAFSTDTEFSRGTILFNRQSGSSDPVIADSVLNNVRVSFVRCTDLEISNNIMSGGTSIDLGSWDAGVRVLNNLGVASVSLGPDTSDCVVTGNEVDFIHTWGTSHTIENNLCRRIEIYEGPGHQVRGNTLLPVEGGTYWESGIFLKEDSAGNTIRDNELTGGIIRGDDTAENTIQGNRIEGGFICLFNAQSSLIKQNTIVGSPEAGIELEGSADSIENNTINGSLEDGIRIIAGQNTVIAFNHVWGGPGAGPESSGILITYGDGIGVHENILESYYYGITLSSLAGNTWVYNNLFRDNQRNAVDDGTGTVWNKPKTAVESNIVGGPFLGGNYWSDYTGPDADGDKLGDIPYLIYDSSDFAAGTDHLPLIWVSIPTPSTSITDYNGDGTSDIAIFRPASGLWAVRTVTRAYFGSTNDFPVPGDYDGDGTTDMAIFRGSSGLWAIRGGPRVYFGTSGDRPLPRDYSGDGTVDIGLYRPSSGLWAIRQVTRIYFGSSADLPVPGYYDGMKASPGIFRPASGLWAIKGVTRTYFGSWSDEPVSGDYAGDGRWSPAIFRESSGLWAIPGGPRVYFGGSGDEPVPGGYRGDGTDYPGIFRPASGLWAIRGVTRAYFGSGQDVPVTR